MLPTVHSGSLIFSIFFFFLFVLIIHACTHTFLFTSFAPYVALSHTHALFRSSRTHKFACSLLLTSLSHHLTLVVSLVFSFLFHKVTLLGPGESITFCFHCFTFFFFCLDYIQSRRAPLISLKINLPSDVVNSLDGASVATSS